MSDKPINDGGPAFPRTVAAGYKDESCEGMSLRDYFAAKAMIGFVNDAYFGTNAKPHDPWPWIAEQSYKAADAMLKARKQ